MVLWANTRLSPSLTLEATIEALVVEYFKDIWACETCD